MHKLKASVLAVMVTYGNRAGLVQRSMQAAFDAGIDRCILIDNASEPESALTLQQMAQQNKAIELYRFAKNTGSAGGFKQGLILARQSQADFVWLLDDDNAPQADALHTLLHMQSYLTEQEGSDLVVYAYRGGHWLRDRLAIEKGIPRSYQTDQFAGIHWQVLLQRWLARHCSSAHSYPVLPCSVGPYGGMLLPMSLARNMDLPNERYFLYVDDHAYSLAMHQAGVHQYLIRDARIHDLDASSTSHDGGFYFAASSNEMKLFYGLRNHLYLNQQARKNHLLYAFHGLLFFVYLFFQSLPSLCTQPRFFLRRWRCILRAVRAGHQKTLQKDAYREDE